MIYFKACPRCLGDVTTREDLYGRYLECLQCGHEMQVQEGAERPHTSPQTQEGVRAVVA